MSLNWQWNDKMGELVNIGVDGKEYTHPIYQGNCLMIITSEWVDEATGKKLYSLCNFFSNLDHLKNCLGTSKDYTDNIVAGWNWKEIRLNLRYKSVPKIVAELVKAKMPITITLYEE